ncbi:phosphoribosylanthranilate isomerase [Halalkalibacter sp. APA_J-10(15)]|uniref:phosphoribosylanthranilate isomerase n=1 Tax=unclassified Halalkalibacter TaxID=2893063 RepID=UPI001FF1D844|nr:phosphoribosylanthranilate isomerase [Halalkalibacter sp. APA_J-10(15)]MCK0472114.1 phosphoribosylanthranilate isomerase [Halalkalibacter sp. APA_J-10(15)]
MPRPLLKLCGNHSEHDVSVAFSSTAEYIGFVFAESKRRVSREQLERLLDNDHDKQKKVVALFVNEPIEEIQRQLVGLNVDIIQCHGNEPAEYIRQLKSLVKQSIWKVIHHHDNALETMKTYEGLVDGYVIDCKVGQQWGGTGVSFDWRFVPQYIEEGHRQQVPVWIAGGINPNNIENLLRYEPDGVDLSSGIEENGRKSYELVRQLEERMNRNGTK